MKRAPAANFALWLALGLLHSAMTGANLLEEAERHHCGGPCPHQGAVASLEVRLLGAGSHRQLVYRLELGCPQQISDGVDGTVAAATQQRRCGQAAVLQPLPPAVFADIYELDNAAAVGQGPAVLLFGPVDVESIERRSQPTLLAVYSGNGSAVAAVAPAEAADQVRDAPVALLDAALATLLGPATGVGQSTYADAPHRLRVCRAAIAGR